MKGCDYMIWQEARDIVRNELIDFRVWTKYYLKKFFNWLMKVIHRFLYSITILINISIAVGIYQGYKTYIDYKSGMLFMESEHFTLFAFFLGIGLGATLLKAITSTFDEY